MTIGANYHYVRSVLVSSPQSFTTSWVDLGDEIEMMGYSALGVYLSLVVNFDSDMRIRALAKLDSGGTTEYNFVIKTLGSSVVRLEDRYYEFTDDADGNYLLEFETECLVPYLQLQIQIGTAFGAKIVPAKVSYCEIIKVLK